jgi:signal transduction histidine kinase/DNA-binding response OmpR family regulator
MLKYDQNSFSVNFNVSNYALADMVEYSYKIEGIDDKWCTINDNDLTLRNLSPGSYRLYVRARLHNRQWSKKITTLDIIVSPPLWMTWWARLLYLFIVSHVAYLIFKTYSRHLKLEYNYKVERKNRKQQEELNEERLRFFTNITHELRTPLTLITAPLDDMSHSKSLPEKTRRRLKVIHKSAQHLTYIINQMLEFRKVESESKVINVANENIVDLLREECMKFEELNQNVNVSIIFESSEDKIYLYFDRDILTTVIDNLMTNASKYTAKGYIKISVRRGMGNENNLIYISVSDTGYGISPEALPHVFENYYQEMGPHQASGTGIGLALVKRLVELHQGNITVTSTVGKGTTFSVSFNYDYTYPNAKHKTYDGLYMKPLVDDEENVVPEKVNGDDTEQSQRKLLVVDDNLDICNYISEQLREEFMVYIAGNGQEGLEIARREMPNIIISDIMMPVMDGTQMCRKLKGDMHTSNIPIILLTAKDSEESMKEGYESGADAYIVKPFSSSLLKTRIHNLLRQRSILSGVMTATPIDAVKKRNLLRQAMDKSDKEFFDKMNNVIEQNIGREIDVNSLAEYMAISTSTLYRKMKTLTGISTNEYIRRCKMQYAEGLLLKGRYSINEITYMIGMSSVAYFRKCFKEEYGELPSQYLKRIKEQINSI